MWNSKLSVTICLAFFLQIASANYFSDPHVRDLRVLTEWFEGEFDNDAQIWFEGRRDWPGKDEEKHVRMHATHQKIHNSALGDHVFYVEEYINDDPSELSRQRIVQFSTDVEAGGIRMAIYFIKDAGSHDSLLFKQELLSSFSSDHIFELDGCDVIFKRQGEQYHGSMESRACQFGEGELKRYSVHDVILSKHQYWRVDRTFLVSDNSFHRGHPNNEAHKMRRATYYDCDVSFYEKAYYIPSDLDKKFKEIKVHNQGGMVWFDNSITDKTFGLQLREKEYPFYQDGSDFFMMRFIEKGALASSVIVTSEPHPKKISFQIGWASAACYLSDSKD